MLIRGLVMNSRLQAIDTQIYLIIFQKGIDLYQCNQLEDAIVQFKQATNKNPNESELYYYYGNCYFLKVDTPFQIIKP